LLKEIHLKFNKSLIIFFATIFSWFPVFFVSFLNDDYQIIGFHFNKGFFELFDAFWGRGVYYHYWRPIPDFIHGLTLFIAGFQPFPFRTAGIVIYTITCIQIYRTLKFLGLKEKTAFAAALLFAVLPSHILEVAWIADQLESLVACFLLLSFLNYIKVYFPDSTLADAGKPRNKYLFFSGFWFAAALLTKEVAYTGIFIPIIFLIYSGNISRQSLLRAAKDILAGLLILVIIFIYRFIFIGGTPFAATHFTDISIPGMFKNLFIYVPLAFFPPEFLELIYSLSNAFIFIIITLLLLCLIYLIVRKFKNLSSPKRNLIYAGAAWFIVFIIPALPTLMRWYVFTASIGLILILAVLLEDLLNEKFYYTALTGVIIIFCFYNINTMFHWKETGIKLDKALISIRNLDQKISSDTLYLWCVPDKFRRVPMMKLGIRQSVEWALNKSGSHKIKVLSPLRSELVDTDSKITLKERSGSTFGFHLLNGRFLEKGGESKSVIKNEELFYQQGGIELKIKTLNKGGNPESIAAVKFSGEPEGDHIYYNGEEFILIKKKN